MQGRILLIFTSLLQQHEEAAPPSCSGSRSGRRAVFKTRSNVVDDQPYTASSSEFLFGVPVELFRVCHCTMSSSASNDFKKRKELEEARKAGTAEVNLPLPKTAALCSNLVAVFFPVTRNISACAG
jgi:hypothetical protein